MSTVDLYVSKSEVFDGPQRLAVMLEVSYSPIHDVKLLNYLGVLTTHYHACPVPSMTVDLGTQYEWTITHDQDVVNVEVEGLQILAQGVLRRCVPPSLLYSFARQKQHGVTIIKGKDPFGKQVSDAQLLLQRDLRFAEGVLH